MARLPRPRKTKAGTWRWRAATYRRPDGRRGYATGTCRTQAEAKAAIAEVVAARHRGAPIASGKATVGEILETYRRARSRGKAPGTRRNLDGRVAVILRHFGAHRTAVTVSHADAEAFLDWLLEQGGARGGPLAPVTAAAALGTARAAFALAFDTGVIGHRPFAPVRYTPKLAERAVWSRPQLVAFLEAAAPHPLFPAFLLASMGMRPEELNGLRWEHVHLGAVTLPSGLELPHGWLAVVQTRVRVGGAEHVQGAKSRRGRRAQVLDARTSAALARLQLAQREAADAAGPAYANSGYVLADELGRPVKVWRLAAEFHKIRERAGLPRIVFYALRHTMNTELAAEGIPVQARARQMGHTPAENLATYTHEDAELRAAMDRIYGLA